MEKLTIEQKAKAYDNAINMIKDNLDALNEITETGANTVNIQSIRNCFYRAFPELQNEGEESKKWILEYLHDGLRKSDEQFKGQFKAAISWLEKQGKQTNLPQFTFDDVLALQCCMETVKKVQEDKELYERLQSIHGRLYDTYWLEKQGKQKSSDKAEPRFKVGDWIITKDKNVHKDYSVCKIVEIENNRYHLENGDYLDIDTLEQYDYRLWTIQDAKDGDVLSTSKKIFIYNGNYNTYSNTIGAYCSVKHNGRGLFIPEEDEEFRDCIIMRISDVTPATKEQCDLLFQKMKEEGYEWDAEKKELKKLNQSVTKKSEQNGKWKWDEDDEKFFRENILIGLGNADNVGEELYSKIIDWLNLIKKRLS